MGIGWCLVNVVMFITLHNRMQKFMQQENSNGTAVFKQLITQRDKLIYAVISVLLGILAFFSAGMYSDIDAMKLLMRETVTIAKSNEQRFIEDHTLLMSVEASRQQNIVFTKQIEERLKRIENGLFHAPRP